MTINLIEKRLAELRARQAALLNDVQAYHGAIQDCEYWLSVLRGSDDDANNNEGENRG